jgi:hypothetical protein
MVLAIGFRNHDSLIKESQSSPLLRYGSQEVLFQSPSRQQMRTMWRLHPQMMRNPESDDAWSDNNDSDDSDEEM